MALDTGFLDYVLDQLGDLPELTSQRLFSGVSIYSGGVIFAIIFADQLFFKTDAQSRPAYVSRGMKGFRTRKDKPDLNMSYYTVPVEVMENRPLLVEWARRALTVSARPTTKRSGKPQG